MEHLYIYFTKLGLDINKVQQSFANRLDEVSPSCIAPPQKGRLCI